CTPSLCPTAKNGGCSRQASSIAARDTRLAASVLDREIAVSASICSPAIANSITRRCLAMMPLLVQPVAKRPRRFHGIDGLDIEAGFDGGTPARQRSPSHV